MAGKASGNSSITNVAALANVSTATVSRVLSGRRTKDDDIARRVREAAQELNYSVNYAASSLRSDITNTIGLVIPSATENFSARLLDQLEPIIDIDSQQLLLGIGNDQTAQTERIESLAARHADGIIVVTAAGADLAGVLEKYAPLLPIVQVGGRQRSFRTSLVGIDENAAMEQAIGHLCKQGAHAIAYLAGKEISFESAELFAMFHTQIRAFRLKTYADWNRFGERTVQRGYDCVMRLFTTPDGDVRSTETRPDALVCADDAIAFGAMVALHAMRLRVPQDVRLVGYNDSPIATTMMPKLTSIRPPFKQIVSESLRLIAAGPENPAHITLPPQLIIRESTVLQ